METLHNATAHAQAASEEDNNDGENGDRDGDGATRAATAVKGRPGAAGGPLDGKRNTASASAAAALKVDQSL
jgi:hypothetical protein